MSLLKSALGSLRAHPGFAVFVVLLLALGIGANTAIFSVVRAVLLRPLPYPQPGDLVIVRKMPRAGSPAAAPGSGDQVPDNEFLAWIEATPKSFRALAAYRNAAATLQHGNGAVRVPAASVTAEFFPMLGITAWRGRLLAAEDLKPGAPPVAVLSYAAWQSKYGGGDDTLGQIVKLDDVAHTLVGVLPASFEFIDPVQFWRPLQLGATGQPGQLRIQMLRVFGRVRPGTPLVTAQQELDHLSERFWENLGGNLAAAGSASEGMRAGAPAVSRAAIGATAPAGGSRGAEPRVVRERNPTEPSAPPAVERGPETMAAANVGRTATVPGGARPRIVLPFANASAQLVRLQEQLAQQSRQTLWLLLGAVGFVLLIACANIANLQLARAAARQRATAIRAALGASPRRLAVELLAENLLLAGAGGALGALLAWWGTRGLQVWLANNLPRVNPVGVDLPVLVFAGLLAVGTGLAFGLAPAWKSSRIDLLETLKDGGHPGLSGGRRWRQVLVAFEVALALVLTVNAGLLVMSLYRLYATNLGYRTADVLTAGLALPRGYATAVQQRDFAARWLVALRSLPGVRFAALTDSPPLSGYNQLLLAVIQGSSVGADASVQSAPPVMAVASVTPDYFRAAGIALRSGRWFAEQDAADAPVVALVNEEFVRTFFPQGLTLGAQVNMPSLSPEHAATGKPPTASIIGVVANIRARGFEGSPQALAYFPLAQVPRTRLAAVLQFEGDAAALARAVVGVTHQIDADLAVDTPQTLAQQIARQTAPRRVALGLTGVFAATAVALAALGVFGVMSYTLTQRVPEIGVRMALGADAGSIFRWMLGYGGTAVGTGLAAGLVLTLATSRLMTSLLYGVAADDASVLGLGLLLLAAVGLAACLAPALRATRVDPIEALRNE